MEILSSIKLLKRHSSLAVLPSWLCMLYTEGDALLSFSWWHQITYAIEDRQSLLLFDWAGYFTEWKRERWVVFFLSLSWSFWLQAVTHPACPYGQLNLSERNMRNNTKTGGLDSEAVRVLEWWENRMAFGQREKGQIEPDPHSSSWPQWLYFSVI